MVEGPILHHLEWMMGIYMVRAPIPYQAIPLQAKRAPAVMEAPIPHRLVMRVPIPHHLDMVLAAVVLHVMVPIHHAAL